MTSTVALATVGREHGWRRLLPALALFLFVPAIPQLRAVVPVEQTLALLVPAMAACAWLGWRHGGRLWFAIGWTAIAVWVLTRPMAGGPEYVAFARGWAILLSAAFGAVGIATTSRAFFGRALGTVALAAAVCALLIASSGARAVRLERAIATELSDRVETSIAQQRPQAGDPDWEDLQRNRPALAKKLSEWVDAGAAQMRAASSGAAPVFPAVLAFESIIALGLAWSLYHRLARTRLGPPMGMLRDFRFDDQLVWGVIAAALFYLVPRFVALRGVGLNLLTFFGVLYGIRGLGVLTWLLIAPGRWLGVAAIGLVCLLPMLWWIPLGLGLGDTWFDLRRRARPSNQENAQ